MTKQQQTRAWQRMLSGRRLDLLDPSPLDVEIEDIAHGLARVARWNGQTQGGHIFSVAQHSLLVEALARAGQEIPEKLDQARLIFERMLGYANHLGLFAEQIGSQGEALGNFPQAFTHLALISAAFNLDRTLSNRN